MVDGETCEIIEEIFEYPLQRHQKKIRRVNKGSKFTFDKVNLFFYYFYNITLSEGGSYIGPPKWLKTRRLK